MTPLYADFRQLDILTGGFRRAFDYISLPLPYGQNIVVGGYTYGGPNGASDVSPERVARFEAFVAEGGGDALLDAWEQGARERSELSLRALQDVKPESLDGAALRGRIRALLDVGRETMARHHINTQGAYAVGLGRLGMFCEARLGCQPAEVIALMSGASPASTEPTNALEAIAGLVRDGAGIDESSVQAAIAEWVNRFGYRLTSFEWDQPLLAEQPDTVRKLVLDAATAGPREQIGSDARIETIRLRFEEGDRDEFVRLVAAARRAYAVRDDDVSHMQWAQGLIRLSLLEAGCLLATTGVFQSADDIWYLRRAEIEPWLQADAPISPKHRDVADRRAAREAQRTALPPAVVGRPAPPPPLELTTAARAWLAARAWTLGSMESSSQPNVAPAAAALLPNELRGDGASHGHYTGPACVVFDESEFDRIDPGAVLICKITSPSWNFVFSAVAALVTDFGGQLSHPAIIAREFGIPAVVGTNHATSRIPDGATVTVDGDTGVVSWE